VHALYITLFPGPARLTGTHMAGAQEISVE
jgi:hypothetical protein